MKEGIYGLNTFIRRIDEVGRIVIPKEIRKSMKIKGNELLEIYINDKKVIIKKHSCIEEFPGILENLFVLINQKYNVDIILTDLSSIIYTSKIELLDSINIEISNEYYRKIKFGKETKDNSPFFLTENNRLIENYLIKPININGDIVGGLIFVKEKDFDNDDNTYINIVFDLLSKYLAE